MPRFRGAAAGGCMGRSRGGGSEPVCSRRGGAPEVPPPTTRRWSEDDRRRRGGGVARRRHRGGGGGGIDEAGDHFEGTAVAWDDEPGNLHALIRFGTSSKNNTHRLENIPVLIIDNYGNAVSAEFLKNLKESSGITYPATVTVDIALNGKNLSVKWESSIGTHGSGIAAVPKTRDGQKSNLRARRLNTWDGFKDAVNTLEAKRYIFRGQESNEWRLLSSFYRSGRANLERYLSHDACKRHLVSYRLGTASRISNAPVRLDVVSIRRGVFCFS